MTIDIDPAALRGLERNEAKAHRIQRGGALNAIFDVVEDQALQGQAVKFNTPFPYKGDWIMLRSECFGDTRRARIGFWIDHEASLEVASTDDALELIVDEDGLQFRLDLDRCRLGAVVARMSTCGNRSSMSVGSDIHAEHREMISGRSVRVVTRATLREITLCKEGAAGNNAFAYVVDKTFTPKPVAGHRSAMFEASQTLHKVSRVVRTLKAQATVRYGRAPQSARSMTLDQLNQMKTAEVEALQKQARARLA